MSDFECNRMLKYNIKRLCFTVIQNHRENAILCMKDIRILERERGDIKLTKREKRQTFYKYIVAYLRHIRIVTLKHAPAITQ
jgi:hypothetical protein